MTVNEKTNLQTNEENTQTNELITFERETEDYKIMRSSDGTFSRKAKFKDYSSITPQTREEKIWLMNLLDGDEETGNGLKEHVGKNIEVANIITRKYDSLDEETGELQDGVLTYLITPQKEVYVTSAKAVYFSINRIMDLFGKPTDEDWENVIVQVRKEKGTNGDMIKIKMVG